MIRRWVTPKITKEGVEPAGFDSFDLRLGDIMRGERATLGKSLLDVQAELRIKAAYIAAIENCDTKAFDTPSFIAGYVRSYARYLGMEPEWAFEAFCHESGFQPTHGLAPQARAKAEKANRQGSRNRDSDPLANAAFVPQPSSIFEGIEPGAVGSVAVLVALIGVLGFGGYSVLREIQKVNFAPVEQSVGVLEDLPGLGTGGAGLAGDPGASVLAGGSPDAGGVTPPTTEALDRLYRPQALDVPVLIARDGPISTLDPAEVGVLANAGGARSAVPADATLGSAVDEAVAAVAKEPAPALAPEGAVRVFGPDAPEVAIFAVRPSWVRVRGADGSVILEKILDAGERYVLPKLEAAPTLRSGNSGSVYFAVNGTAYGPAGEGASVTKNVVLAPDALTEAYAMADPSADDALAEFVAVAEADLQ